jgi:hypothetical protein
VRRLLIQGERYRFTVAVAHDGEHTHWTNDHRAAVQTARLLADRHEEPTVAMDWDRGRFHVYDPK